MKFPEIRPIKTERLLLRKQRLKDIEMYYHRLGSSEAVTRYMLWSPHRDIAESESSVRKVLKRYSEGRCYRWAVALPEDDSIIGIIELLRFQPETGECSFAYMLAEEFWGMGYGTEVLKAVLDFAFREMDVEAVEADHMVANVGSGAVMRKAGMEYIRTETCKYRKNGEWIDTHVYRIRRDRWQKLYHGKPGA